MSIKFPRAEFFDIFGVPVFLVITFLSGRAFLTDQAVPRWGIIFLLVVGVLGVLVDGTIVSGTYLKNRKTSGAERPPVVK